MFLVRCISNEAYHLQDHTVALPAENVVEPNNKETISQILQQCNFTCKAFTTAMAIKHQLQYSIFNAVYYFNDSNGLTSEGDIRKLISSLEHIETIASILQNMEVQLHCIHTI